MPEAHTISLAALPAALPRPVLALDGRPWRGGTVAAYLAEQRDSDPLPGLVWHAKVDADQVWSHPLELRRAHQPVLFGLRSLWLVVTWAGRRVGQIRLRISP